MERSAMGHSAYVQFRPAGPVPRDIGADEYVGPFRRVEFGVQGGAYTVVSAFPVGVLTDPVNVVLDDPEDTGDAPTANPGITLVVGQRYEFVVNDATSYPIQLVALGDATDGSQDLVLAAQDRYELIEVSTNVFDVQITESIDGTFDDDSVVSWTEELPDNLPDESPVAARVSFLFTQEIADAMQQNGTPGYRAAPGNANVRGIVQIGTSLDNGDTGFPYWWKNFK